MREARYGATDRLESKESIIEYICVEALKIDLVSLLTSVASEVVPVV